jgi:hypothetical protein
MNKWWLYAFLVCLITVPALIYLVGGLIVGPYEGEGGLSQMMGTIYVDAMTGHLSAWLLLLAPLLLALIWKACNKLRRIALSYG